MPCHALWRAAPDAIAARRYATLSDAYDGHVTETPESVLRHAYIYEYLLLLARFTGNFGLPMLNMPDKQECPISLR